MRRDAAEPSLEDISDLIGHIYDVGVDKTSWPGVLRRMGGLFGSTSATVWMQDGAAKFQDVQSVQDPRSVRDYAEHYGSLDRLRPAVMRAPIGTVLANWMVVTPSEFVRTEFYNDFANRYDMQDCMQVRLLDDRSASGFIGMARSKRVGVFQHRDLRLLSLLVPHLRRAMRTHMHLVPAGIGPGSTLEALDRLTPGVLIVDAEARVIHANRAAELVLAKADGLDIGPDGGERRLRAATHDQTQALRRLVAQAAALRHETTQGGGVLRLLSQHGASLLASVSPLRAEVAWNAARRPAALILLSPCGPESAPSPEHLRALYGLTPAETAVAGRIMQGDGVKAAARALRIAPATLRTHLSRVFEKTETCRQAELVRLLQQVARVNQLVE